MTFLDDFLNSFTRSGFKKSLRPLYFESPAFAIEPANTFTGSTKLIPVQQELIVLWFEFAIVQENVGGVSSTVLQNDLNIITLVIDHNGISMIEQEPPTLLSQTPNIRKFIRNISLNVLSTNNVLLSASGRIPIFKKIGPGGRLRIGRILNGGGIVGDYQIAGVLYVSTP